MRKRSYYERPTMARKRHHSSKKQSMMSRYHEHSGEERHLHGYHPRRSYDMLRHEKDMHNDERMHDSEPERSGPYHYDRQADGMMSRRRSEMRDAGMIHEDRSQIANLPQEVMMKPYPKNGPYMPEGLDDTIRGVDHQMDYDDSKRRSHNVPKKV